MTENIRRSALRQEAQRQNAALRAGIERMQRASEARRGAPRGRIPHYQMDAAVYWHGVAQNGVEAMRPGSDFMRDMQRRHPWIGDPHDAPGSAHKPNLIFRGGEWYRRVPGTHDYERQARSAKAPWWCEQQEQRQP